MLNDSEIKKIDNLIKQGFSNYRIGKITKHSPNTIKRRREELEKNEQKQTSEEDIVVQNPIEISRKIINMINPLIQTKQLDDKEKKKLERLLEPFQVMVKEQVDDRIPSERTDAANKRDLEWNQLIQQQYVKKEVVTQLQKTIQDQQTTITYLQNNNIEKDKIHETDQIKICNLLAEHRDNEKQIRNLTARNNALENTNFTLNSYIDYKLNTEIRHDQEQLKKEWAKLNAEKTRFDEFRKKQLSALTEKETEYENRIKAVDIQENNVTKLKKELQKRKDAQNETENNYYNKLQEIQKALENRINEASMNEKNLKIWVEKQRHKILELWKILKNWQEQLTKKQETLTKTDAKE